MDLTVYSYHVTDAFQSESTTYSCLSVKKILAQNKHNIKSLSSSIGTWTLNHLLRKSTLNHLAKLTN